MLLAVRTIYKIGQEAAAWIEGFEYSIIVDRITFSIVSMSPRYPYPFGNAVQVQVTHEYPHRVVMSQDVWPVTTIWLEWHPSGCL